MPRQEPTPEELEGSRESRVAAKHLELVEMASHFLDVAIHLRADANLSENSELATELTRVRELAVTLNSQASGRVATRKRPKTGAPSNRCWVFLDECGQHTITAKDPFKAFVLAAVIIREEDLAAVDALWRRWKVRYLGGDRVVHEPDVRKWRSSYRSFDGTTATAELDNILEELDFAAVAVAVHRPDYEANFGSGPLDESLPSHAYMMALDFMAERLVMVLDEQFGARATLVAESRGPREDAMLQHEFARLHLDGTSYIHESWFRQQFCPGMEFRPKGANNTGLQLADLLARPVAEKVLDPEADPARWSTFKNKLCRGTGTKNSILGLKIVPWDQRYESLLES